jgi:hypothetical protein
MSAHSPGPWHRNIAPARKYVVVWSGRNKHVAKLITDGLSEDALADFEHELEHAPQITAEDRRQWARDDADEAWGEERRAA